MQTFARFFDRFALAAVAVYAVALTAQTVQNVGLI